MGNVKRVIRIRRTKHTHTHTHTRARAHTHPRQGNVKDTLHLSHFAEHTYTQELKPSGQHRQKLTHIFYTQYTHIEATHNTLRLTRTDGDTHLLKHTVAAWKHGTLPKSDRRELCIIECTVTGADSVISHTIMFLHRSASIINAAIKRRHTYTPGWWGWWLMVTINTHTHTMTTANPNESQFTISTSFQRLLEQLTFNDPSLDSQ